MQCPRCHLENPPSTEVCDCGYSFVTGSYVPKAFPPRLPHGVPSVEVVKTRYAALESISTIYRGGAWFVTAALVLVGIVILIKSTDEQKTFAIPAAASCFIGAAVQWLLLKAVAEAITLFIDIAYDVRAIAAKVNNSQ